MKPQRKTRLSSGFSMVELVIVILIIAVLAVAIFAGSSIAVEKSRDKRVTSDFHNFDVGAENYLYSNQQFQNGATLTTLAAQQEAILDLNPFLSANYAFDTSVQAPATGDICNTDASLYAFPSAKMDPWGNPYYVIIDNQSRNPNETETYLTVFSAGKNGKADMGGALDKDDQFLLLQFINGEVISKTYSMKESPKDAAGKTLTAGQTRLSSASGVAPVNKAVTMAASSGGTTGGGSSSGGSSGGTTPSRPSEGGGSSSGGSSGGGESGDSSTTVCNHAYTLTSMKQATCKANGEEKYTCAKCGNVYTKSTPKLEHNYSMIVSRTPSCVFEGEKKYTCSNCGDVYTEPIAKIAHSYEKTSTIASTCTVAGKEIYKCKTCTDSYEKALPLINHKYGTDHKCTMCGKRDPNYTPAAPTLLAEDKWYKGTGSLKKTITKITIMDEYTPSSGYDESWNADVGNKGEIKCYRTGTKLIIAGNGAGKIKANQNSACAFSDYTYSRQMVALQEIENLEMLDTSNVTDMSYMFYNDSSLANVDVSKFDTSKVTDMKYMFRGCKKLSEIDVSNFNTSKVTNMANMFWDCIKLTSVNISNFDTSKVTFFSGMFYNCSELKHLDISNFDTSSATSLWGMFYSCKGLTELDISTWDTSKTTDFSILFSGCSGLTGLDVSSLNTSNATDMGGMFGGCRGLKNLDISTLDTSNATDVGGMFNGCSGLTSLDISSLDTSNATDVSYMFSGCTGLTNIDISTLDTSNATDVGGIFANCSKLKTIDVSKMDTSKATNMRQLFDGCKGITSLDLSTFDTSNVKDFSMMFRNCDGLTTLDLSSFDTGSATMTIDMFDRCERLKTIYVSNKWTMSKVSNSKDMFFGCNSLKGDIKYNSVYRDKTYAKTTGGYLTLKSSCDHEYVETVTKEATCTATGTKQFVCSKCADSYTKIIPMAAHNYNENNVCTVCGKSNSFVPGKIQ